MSTHMLKNEKKTKQKGEKKNQALFGNLCVNCHLANKPVDVEVPQVVLFDTIFEVVVQIPYNMQLK